MGVPWLEAPCEAEAQCAALAKARLDLFLVFPPLDVLIGFSR
jgi:5'-3' exonuclease